MIERQAALAQQRIPGLDGLRGLAILLVIVCHYIANAQHAQLGFWPHRFLAALTVGWSGVDLFFVLSGFLIGGILLQARNAANYFRAFYLRRVFRILPVYYLWTLLYAALIAGALWFFPGRYSIDAGYLLRVPVQLLFLQNFFIGMAPFTWIWFVVTWSLAVEEQFYLLAPPLIRFLSERNLVIALVATICLAPVLRLLIFHWIPGSFAASYLMPCRADDLAWGILIALAWRRESFRNFLAAHGASLQIAMVALVFGAAGLVWWLVRPLNVVTVTIGLTWLGLLYSCLLLLVLSQTHGWLARVMRWKALRSLGGISYCVYIVHDTFNQLAHRILLRSEPEIYNFAGVAVTLLALALTLSVATLSWRYFEEPLLRIGRAFKYENRATASLSTLESSANAD